MKDPLQYTRSPYEILGVQINADSKQIFSAFIASTAKPGTDKSEIKRAFDILSNPQERAFVDLFLYHEPFLNQLIPSIDGDGTQLRDNRMDIAQVWSNIQKQAFPKFAATHGLALLWYTWALYCEEENFSKKEKFTSAPPLTQLWSNTISHWVYLMNSTEFMNEWIESKRVDGTDPNNVDIKKLCKSLEDHLKSILYSFNRSLYFPTKNDI